MNGLYDWVTSPVDSARQQWAAMIADWDAREQRAQALIDDLQSKEDYARTLTDADFQEWQRQLDDGKTKLNRMYQLDDIARQVKSWFVSTGTPVEGATMSSDPLGLGILPAAFPAGAVLGVVAASAAFAMVGYWAAQAVEYIAQLNARYQIFMAAKANGATDQQAIDLMNASVPGIPTSGAGTNITEWLMIGAVIFLLPQILGKGDK